MKYAGIGSRKTPVGAWHVARNIGMVLASKGILLRSGGAHGADKAFEFGCDRVQGQKEIWRPEQITPDAIMHASKFHPAWDSCDQHAKMLHARNSMIMLGQNLDDPVDFVVCWTPNGYPTGGTGQALRIAKAHEIPVFNLFNDPRAANLMSFVNAL